MSIANIAIVFKIHNEHHDAFKEARIVTGYETTETQTSREINIVPALVVKYSLLISF